MEKLPYVPKKTIAYSKYIYIEKPLYITPDGFWTNRYFAIKGEILPAIKRLKDFRLEKTPVIIEKLIPKDIDKNPAKILSVLKPDKWIWKADFVVGLKNNKGDIVVVNKDYLDIIKKQFPNAIPYFNKPNTPIVFKKGKEIKAILMPIRDDGELSKFF